MGHAPKSKSTKYNITEWLTIFPDKQVDNFHMLTVLSFGDHGWKLQLFSFKTVKVILQYKENYKYMTREKILPLWNNKIYVNNVNRTKYYHCATVIVNILLTSTRGMYGAKGLCERRHTHAHTHAPVW